MVIVLMGPAGAGKSTVGTALASRLGWTFVEGDEYHPTEHLERMARGQPLEERQRAEWLHALHAIVRQAVERRAPLVLACSALSRDHRERLAGGLRTVRFVYLKTAPDVLRARLENRSGHFAGASLLASQLSVLREPEADEAAIVIDGAADVDTIVGHIRLELGV